MTVIAGGEVRGASEVEQVKAHLKVLVAQLEVAGKGSSALAQSTAVRVLVEGELW